MREAALLRLLRVAYDHGQSDALAYADVRSTRSAAYMPDDESDHRWETWVQLNRRNIDRLTS